MNTQSAPPLLTRAHLFAAAFFTIFIVISYQMVRILAPFASSLIWAAIIAIAMHPLYRRVLRVTRNRPGPAAGIMTAIAFLLVIVPAAILFSALTSQAVGLYEYVYGYIQSGKWAATWESIRSSRIGSILAHPALDQIDVKGRVIKALGDLSSGMAAQLGGALKNILLLVVNFLIMLFALFFFFRDGESWYRTAVDILPFTPEQKENITSKMSGTFSAVINGIFLIALLQGVVTGVGFAIFGLSFSVFWGFFAFILALLPVVGAAGIWVPGALYLLLTGSTIKGILLAVWGTLFVSLPDNFLKPILIGRKAKLPIFFLFIGILGGLKVYGFLGILFGPLIVTLLTVFITIYREEYANK